MAGAGESSAVPLAIVRTMQDAKDAEAEADGGAVSTAAPANPFSVIDSVEFKNKKQSVLILMKRASKPVTL